MGLKLFLLCLTALFALSAAQGGGGACQGVVDCNAKYCLDCACVSGKCECADGYLGPNCETPFCVNRADCSGHGECVAARADITCECDPGYSGPKCAQKHCTLECGHGGTPDAACTVCDGCTGAWRGATPTPSSVFYAYPQARGGDQAINSYTCPESQILYRSSLPANCTLQTAAVFLAPNKTTSGAMQIYEYQGANGARVWTNTSTPPSGTKLVASPFFALASPVTEAMIVRSSALCVSGTCQSFLSLDQEEHKACTAWDTSVPLANLSAALTATIQASLDAQKALSASNPIHGGLGFGVDIVVGAQTQLPVVRLNYSDPTRTWHKFLYPVEASVLPFENPKAQCDVQVFNEVGEYATYVQKQTSSGAGIAGVYGTPFATVLSNLFLPGSSNPDPSVSVVQAQYGVYKIALMEDPFSYELDKFASRAILALPPNYIGKTNQALYQQFISMWGTSFTWSSTVGGLLEQRTQWSSWLPSEGFTAEMLSAQAGVDLTNTTQFCGFPGTHNAQYVDNRAMATSCMGGDVSICPGKILDWIPTIETDPVPLSFTVASISELVRDPKVKANLEQAVTQWVTQQNNAWDALDKCPKCAHGSACAHPSLTCACPPHGEGHTCLRCTPGWNGDTCATPICTKPCLNTGKCVAPDTCSCPAHGTGPQCQCAQGWNGADCGSPICKSPCLNTGKCSAPDTCSCPLHGTGKHCECEAGWGGADCSLEICTPPCVHGHCVTPGGSVCMCNDGWTGSVCDRACGTSNTCHCGIECTFMEDICCAGVTGRGGCYEMPSTCTDGMICGFGEDACLKGTKGLGGCYSPPSTCDHGCIVPFGESC